MQIEMLKKRLVGIDRTLLAITELCERRAPTGVHVHLSAIQQDARRLEFLLRQGASGSRCAETLQHLKQAGRHLLDSCADVDHKDTRAALEDLTAVLITLPQPASLTH